jgi:hypothetical protein
MLSIGEGDGEFGAGEGRGGVQGGEKRKREEKDEDEDGGEPPPKKVFALPLRPVKG